VPQLAQKLALAGFAVPHRGQLRVPSTRAGAPQCRQKRALAGTGWPQLGHAVALI
jgi:hypothetical protein